MVDLSTTYLGLQLKNPLVAAASPFTKKFDLIRRLEDSGVSAVVMYSLFEEQITHESKALNHFLSRGTESFAEAITYFPEMEHYNIGPEGYLELIQKVKKSVEIPVIASLNGISTGGWVDYARKMEQAGADALELNIYYVPTDFELTSASLEKAYIDLVSDVHKALHIPLAVKLSPYFTALPHFANALIKAGANGLVLFNRFYQPDLDIETLEVVPNLNLSNSEELRLPLRWTAILYGRVKADIAITGGVHTAQDVVKSMMAGASVAQIASVLMKNCIEQATEILNGLKVWMEQYEYDSIQKMRGNMSQKNVAEPAAFERANYMKVLTSFDKRLIS